MFKTKTSRSLVFFGGSAVVGIGSMWWATGNFQSAALFYVVSSVIVGGAIMAVMTANEWVSKGEE